MQQQDAPEAVNGYVEFKRSFWYSKINILSMIFPQLLSLAKRALLAPPVPARPHR